MSGAVLFQSMPPLSPDEYEALASSIREHGIQVPILVDENDVVIDGHHRRKIADELGIACPRRHVVDLDDTAKRALSLSLNLDRRHLTREQRRALVAESLKADPQLSNREHARRTGVSDKTVASIRGPLADRAEIPHVSERTDSLGRQQPATKPGDHLRRATWPERRDNPERIDPATGEVLGSVAALAEVVANSHPISRGAVDNLGENLNTGPQGIELGTRSEPNERVTVIEVLEDRVVGLEAGLDPREDILNAHTGTVANITGPDGKTYKRTERTATRRRPLPDVALDAAHALTAAVARMERVFTDDRYPQNKEQVARYTRHHLPQAVETLQRLADEITR